MSELDRAHIVGRELLRTLHEYWEVLCDVYTGMAADDPRLDEITRMKARVRDGLERAKAELLPALHDFACVHQWPVSLNGFTGSSAHQVAMKIATWVGEQRWSTTEFRQCFERYYDAEKRRLDWDSMRAADDSTYEGLYAFWDTRDWGEHEALLEMEYAKAKRLSESPKAEVPLIGGDVEAAVLEALGDEVLVGPEIAAKSGYDYSYLRDRLPRMVEKKQLEKVHPRGYRRATPELP